MKRTVIEIDEKLCTGCGLCAQTCHQGAIQIIDGKARLMDQNHCDGLGRCLGECPVGAIKMIEKAVEVKPQSNHKHKPVAGGCPGSLARAFEKTEIASDQQDQVESDRAASELRQWPVQLHLLSPGAPFFENCDLLLAADCCAFAVGGFHAELLRGKTLAIACPKLDDTSPYLDKLTAILANNHIESFTVAIMEVPCCRGLEILARQALVNSGKDIPLNVVTVSLDGKTK